MAVFSCNGCGSDDVLIEYGYCPSCAYDRNLITENELNDILDGDYKYQIGQEVIWIGLSHRFERTVTIVDRATYHGEIAYHIHDAIVVKGTVYSIPESQLITPNEASK